MGTTPTPDPRLQMIVTAATGLNTDLGEALANLSSEKDQVQSLAQQNQLLHAAVDTDERKIQDLGSQLKSALDRLAAPAPAVFEGLELTPWLLAPGAAANTGSTGSLAVATQGQPGINSAWFSLAPKGPYANGYFFKKLGADPTRKNYKFEVALMFGSPVDAAASQALELDIQQVISGMVYNTGLQFDFEENALRVWDRAAKEAGDPNPWKPTGLPCPRWTAGKWMRGVYTTHRDDSNVYVGRFDLNGTTLLQPNSVPFAAPHLGLTDMLNCAIQLDGNQSATAYKVYLGPTRFTAS
jgi:hypothetical protein